MSSQVGLQVQQETFKNSLASRKHVLTTSTTQEKHQSNLAAY